MNQDTTNKSFPVQQILDNIKILNKDIDDFFSKKSKKSQKLQKSQIECIIKLLFDSVIEGEFIRNCNIVQNLKEVLSNLSSEYIDYKIEKKKLRHEYKELVLEIKELIEHVEDIIPVYLKFIEEFRFLINEDVEYIFPLSILDLLSKEKKYEINLFKVFLNICIYDVKLNESRQYISTIEFLKSLIDDKGYLCKQKEKMLKKANFLVLKWYRRAEKNEYDITSVTDRTEKSDYIKNYSNEWKEIVEYIDNHYSENSKRQIKYAFNQIKDKKLEDYSCKEIHLYIKYYKDNEKELNKLDDIINVIKNKVSDDNIYKTILQYAINNRFSLFLEKHSDRNKIYEEYKKISTDNRNYFPQYKFIEKSLNLLTTILQKGSVSLEELSDIENFINKKIEPEYKKYKANMEWSSQHSNFIYRVAYEECMIDDIFIYSSFVLPAPNKKSYDDYEKISSEYYTLKAQIEPFKKVSILLLDVEKNQVKIIELMGLFLAVIAFVMSSISGFKFIDDFRDTLLFMIIFSTSLISFLLILILITRHNESVLKKHWYEILIFYLAILGLIYCIRNF